MATSVALDATPGLAVELSLSEGVLGGAAAAGVLLGVGLTVNTFFAFDQTFELFVLADDAIVRELVAGPAGISVIVVLVLIALGIAILGTPSLTRKFDDDERPVAKPAQCGGSVLDCRDPCRSLPVRVDREILSFPNFSTSIWCTAVGNDANFV